ncbi:hypothetical protein ACRCUN_32135 [Mycobacterium sp. LTG2003]
MTELSLTPAEAQAKITQVDEAMATAKLMGDRILDQTETMTAGSWQGGRAATFRAIMTQHREDFGAVINRLQAVADKGKADIQKITAHDEG